MDSSEVQSLLDSGEPYVVRIKMDPERQIQFSDIIRGEVSFECAHVDDKVLLKADGMPTYHLAVVVDDHMMQVTHAFRGEEWLPSAPVHILLWEYLFGLENMPQWAHLPLILKPDGHGKLSKRDGERLGFPVYAMNWQDPVTGTVSSGFKEMGFLPEAFVNFLAMLGWNDGSEKEIFSLEELVQAFSIDRIHKGGAKFDFEKAKWYNHEWIKRSTAKKLFPDVLEILNKKGIPIEDQELLLTVIELVKDRCTLLTDFYEQAAFFFRSPEKYDTESVKPKWSEEKKHCFLDFFAEAKEISVWETASIEELFKAVAAKHGIKVGELQMLFRIMLVGDKIGPAVFVIAAMIGKSETLNRIQKAIQNF
jgi:glutamyl-tRNA synthetase